MVHGGTLDRLRARVDAGVVMLLWAHVAVALAAGAATGGGLLPGLCGVFLVGSATLSWRRRPGTLGMRAGLAATLAATVATIVFAFRGQPWQADLPVYYLAALTILAAYCDWRVLLVGVAAVTLDHLVLGYVLPRALVPAPAELGRLAVHATALAVEAGALGWLAWRLAPMVRLVGAQAWIAETAAATE